MFITTATRNVFSNIVSSFGTLAFYLKLFAWDGVVTLINALAYPLFLYKKVGHVTPAGAIGAGGKWPPYVKPGPTDSRSACPMLNAMANHGILPHDGRNIKYTDMGAAIRTTYNFGPTFCWFVPAYMARLLTRDYNKDTINLSDISVHNGIEHDASLTRHDAALVPDQSVPAQDLISDLLAAATGSGPNGPLLTPADLSRVSSVRRRQARATNSAFSLSQFHKLFGSSNSSTLLTILGGRTDDIEVFLREERIPDGWESRIRAPLGLTFSRFNLTVARVELGIDNRYDVDDAASGNGVNGASGANGANGSGEASVRRDSIQKDPVSPTV